MWIVLFLVFCVCFLFYFCCFYYGSFNCWGPLRLLKCFYLILCVVQVHGPSKTKKNIKSFLSFGRLCVRMCLYVCEYVLFFGPHSSCFQLAQNVFSFRALRHFGNNKRRSAAAWLPPNRRSVQFIERASMCDLAIEIYCRYEVLSSINFSWEKGNGRWRLVN